MPVIVELNETGVRRLRDTRSRLQSRTWGVLQDDTEHLVLPSDPQSRSRFYREKAAEYRALSNSATLPSVRESYLSIARANDIMAEAAEREAQLLHGNPVALDHQ